AIQRTADGLSSLMVVREGKAQIVAVSTGSVIEGQTIITKGLNAGDMVVVEGFQKNRPGAPVQPIPWQQGAPGGAGSPGSAQGGAAGPAQADPGAKQAGDAPAAKPAEQG